jgi:PIN domain nuclease of toxin-antitoxin system
MNEDVLDSSIILAVLKSEAIDESADGLIDGGVMSAVSVAEVYTKLSELNSVSLAQVDAMLATLGRIEPFTAQQARVCGLLRPQTRHLGMSLGDRVCIALGIVLRAVVYTTDGKWLEGNFTCEVRNLR